MRMMFRRRIDGVALRLCRVPPLNKLIRMDVDSAERLLLDTAQAPWLRKADIIVETHECFEAGLNELIEQRFAATHIIRTTRNAGLTYSRYPPLQRLRFEEIYALVGEDRPGLQDWFLMQPR